MNKYLTEPQQPKWNEITYQSMKRDCMTRRRRFRIHIELKHSSSAEEKWKWKDSIYSKLKFPSKLSMHMVKDPLWITFHSIGLAITDWFMTLSSAAGWPLRRHRLVSSVPLFFVVVSLPLLSWSLSRAVETFHELPELPIFILWSETWLWDAAAAAALLDMLLPQETTRHIRWCICSFRFYFHSGGLTGGCVSFGRSSPKRPEGRDERGEKICRIALVMKETLVFLRFLPLLSLGHRLSFGNDEEIN